MTAEPGSWWLVLLGGLASALVAFPFDVGTRP